MMIFASVIKRAVVRRRRVLLSASWPVRHAATAGRTYQKSIAVIFASPDLQFRQFSSTCVTRFRTASSFASYTDYDDSETSGKWLSV